jgi:hypothetical protein
MESEEFEPQEAGCGDPVLLVHGFGASAGQWRKVIPVLAKENKVSSQNFGNNMLCLMALRFLVSEGKLYPLSKL